VTRSATADRAKPAVADLGIDLADLDWTRSGEGDGSIEVAFPPGPGPAPAAGATDAGATDAGVARARWARGDWVLLRVAGDPAGRILVFDRNEWECFIDGARNGEFGDATEEPAKPAGSGEPHETARPPE
jgi:hypothetical protein